MTKDVDRARHWLSIRGVSSQMNRFRYLYGINLANYCWNTPTMSWTLQHTSLLPRRWTSKSGVDEAVETLNGIPTNSWTKVTLSTWVNATSKNKSPFDLMIIYLCEGDETSTKNKFASNCSCSTVYGAMDIFHVKEYFLSLSFLQFIIVIPATNATSERLFTTLRHLKSYLGCRNVDDVTILPPSLAVCGPSSSYISSPCIMSCACEQSILVVL